MILISVKKKQVDIMSTCFYTTLLQLSTKLIYPTKHG